MKQRQNGFTLIEIAIVLVIIGLLLGGVLKGQELITSARVRNLISMQDGIKAAYFGFLDRYRALPGDYAQAVANINGVTGGGACGIAATRGNGNGDGQVMHVAATTVAENVLAWEHLSKSGFINGSYTCAGTAATPASAPTNPYGQYFDLAYANSYGDTAGTIPTRHILMTGANIGSDLLAEVDRKVDDGNPVQGSYRVQTAGTGITAANCYNSTATPPNAWNTTSPSPTCGGVSLY